jgi:hypothetical protein
MHNGRHSDACISGFAVYPIVLSFPHFGVPISHFDWKSEGKTPLGRVRRRWEDNIRMDHRETVCKGVDWMHLVQDGDQWRAVVNTVTNIRVL